MITVDARVPTQRTQMQSYTYPPHTMPQVTLGYGSDETTPVVQEYTRKAQATASPSVMGAPVSVWATRLR